MNVLHLAIDEKFMPFAQKVFETALPGQNQYRVMRRSGGSYLQPSSTVQIVTRSYWFSYRLERDLEWADCVVVHFLTLWSARAIARAPARALAVWHGWGADYYPLLDGYLNRLYLPLTQALIDGPPGIGRWLRRVRGLTEHAKELLAQPLLQHWRSQALRRLDVISVMPEEFEILKRSHPSVHARHHQLYYFSAEESFLPGPPSMTGPDILLGNSASSTNNHLDAFDLLRSLDLGERNLIVPLSYGDATYAEAICRQGRKLFGKRFEPLLTYLSPDEYSARVATCGFVFMNHVRQQGTGNISMAMLKGAKVFLRRENLLMPFYRKFGAIVHEFPDASSAAVRDVFAPLNAEDRKINRRVVMNYWAMDTVVRQTRALQDMVPSCVA